MMSVIRSLIIGVVSLVAWQGLTVTAQDTALDLTLTAEHDIGTQCPLASALQPDTSILWVLENKCYDESSLTLNTYDINTGEALETTWDLETLDPMLYEVFIHNKPLAFTPDGKLQLFVTPRDDDSNPLVRFEIDVASGEVTTDEAINEQLNTLFRQYTSYPAYGVTLSADHQYAALSDDEGTQFYILDLRTEEVVFQTEGYPPSWVVSPDEQRLYLTLFNNPDDYEDYSGTLNIYSLEDSSLIQTVPLSTASYLFPSHDEQHVALIMMSAESSQENVGVIELATGAVSPLLRISGDKFHVLKCANTGNNMSDLDFTSSGRRPLIGLEWLADDSGFVTINSHDGSGTNTGCVFDYSRLRQYTVANN